jgi:hypothetical protein
VFPKTEKRPLLADFFLKYKHIAWSDKKKSGGFGRNLFVKEVGGVKRWKVKG